MAAYRKSLENRSATVIDHTAPIVGGIEKASQRKTFDTKLSSDFRKSLESLDEKKTTPPPVLSKKPVVPIKKSPTVSSVAGNIFSGLKQIVKTDKQSSNDSLDGIGSSKAAVSQVADITEKGVVVERMKKDDSDFDHVERSSILQDMRAGRAKAPKRRLPTSSMSLGSSMDNNNSTTYQNGSNGVAELLFDGSKLPVMSATVPSSSTSDDDSTKPKTRNWEKQKAPWMDELKASQAKKTTPSIGDAAKSPEITNQKMHTAEHHHQPHHESSEKYDMSKSLSNSYVSSTTSFSSSQNKKSIDSSAMETQRSSSVDVKPIAHNIDMASHHNSKKVDHDSIMTKSMSVITSKSISNDVTTSVTTMLSDDIAKIRPSSVNLKNRSVSPVLRVSNTSVASPDAMCLRVTELEQKVAQLEAVVEMQNKTIEELVRFTKELDKYPHFITQV